jgi:hypothetical protein
MQDDEEGWIAEFEASGESFGTASIAGPGCIRRRNFTWPFVGYASSESAQTSRRADAPRCAANVMGRGRRCACGHRGDRDRLIALIRPLSLRCACSSVRCPTMEWSGRAPAPPASKAGKGRRRQGARDVPETRHYHRHRYRQELVSRGGSRSARTATATTATSCEWKRCANRCAS